MQITCYNPIFTKKGSSYEFIGIEAGIARNQLTFFISLQKPHPKIPQVHYEHINNRCSITISSSKYETSGKLISNLIATPSRKPITPTNPAVYLDPNFYSKYLSQDTCKGSIFVAGSCNSPELYFKPAEKNEVEYLCIFKAPDNTLLTPNQLIEQAIANNKAIQLN